MATRAVSRCAGKAAQVAPGAPDHAHRETNGRLARGAGRGALPAMRASVRRRGAACVGDGRRPARKGKRPRRAPGLGGRLAAAIRVGRLRASRAAEEFGLRR